MKTSGSARMAGRWLALVMGFVMVAGACAPATPPAPVGPATGASTAEVAACHPGGATGELVVQTGGGSFGDAAEEILYKTFEKACGVKVIRRDASRAVGQLVAQVQAGQAPFDIGTTQGQVEYVYGVDKGIFYKMPAGFWDPVRKDMIPESITDYGTWCCPFVRALLYSTKAFPNGVNGWKDFWDVKNFPGPRSMLDGSLNLHMALLADGVARDKVYPMDVERALRKMNEIRPHVRAYNLSDALPIQQLQTGEVVMSIGSANRAVAAMKQGAPVGVSWDGAAFITDGFWIMPKTAKNVQAALQFMYWVARPDTQLAFANAIFLAGGNKKVRDGLSSDVRDNLPQSHLETVSPVDTRWWLVNNDAVETRWRAWRATGK